MADCVEACVREVLCLALWDGAAFDTARLPSSADPAVRSFFDPIGGEALASSAGASWFELLQARPGLQYMVRCPRWQPRRTLLPDPALILRAAHTWPLRPVK